MKNSLLLASCLVLLTTTAWSQADDKQAINAVIKTLFDGMYEGDSSKVHSVFDESATMATVARNKMGEPVLRRESSMNGMLKAIGTPRKEKMTEEFWNVNIQLDGDFAQAWCDYAFYIDHTFSHCGVDAFQLYKTKDGWKIFHLADTRRKDGCNIPEEIKTKHSK
ncbi:hypothetical protein SanaruYs_37690 [Chryseotalea sanaruensis]|uniref:Nuclear transport factor 2 family protein n=1 Tax=Chryseotalea sanaruensis TaxID=2482724 RepID=A0A401UF96_9BACT|nr:nuclear transport factor 2 family protein [Chryseotalea sanaruensis]GCC53524.1 hypothetical protein SanaruYs_37690 [Chryseotalea sanaruensis]